jgi:putative oxidoreductase
MKAFTENLLLPAVLAFLVIVAEFAGPLALVAGLLTRVAAFGIGTVMVVAALMGHLPNGFFMNWAGTQKGEGFEYHILATAIALALLLQGGGKWALDSWLHCHLAGCAVPPAPTPPEEKTK